MNICHKKIHSSDHLFIFLPTNAHFIAGDTLTSIPIYDGAESIGGNKIHVEACGAGLSLA